MMTSVLKVSGALFLSTSEGVLVLRTCRRRRSAPAHTAPAIQHVVRRHMPFPLRIAVTDIAGQLHDCHTARLSIIFADRVSDHAQIERVVPIRGPFGQVRAVGPFPVDAQGKAGGIC